MDKLIRDMRDAADVILALPPYSRAIVSSAVQLAVMAQKAADELEKAREIVVLWDMYGGSEGITDVFERAEKARWIPVEERLPEQGEKVLALWKYGSETAVDFAYFMDGSMGERWRYKNWVAPPDAITHWMPLPSVEE